MKKTINIFLYLFLTIINIGTCLYLLDFKYLGTVFVLFVCFLLNQYMLVDGFKNLVDDDGNKKKSIIFLVLKIFILFFAFWYAMRNNSEEIYIFVGNYIFQLIILGLSIKSDTKKIIKEGI